MADDKTTAREKDDLQKGISVCFTGHRQIGREREDEVAKRLDVVIERCIGKGYRIFMAGGAVGFDALAARRVIAAREKNPDVKLYLILPCRDQTSRWKSIGDINEYRYLKENADDIIYIQYFYDNSCMMKRNRYMVDHSSLCVAYFNGRAGGTANTVKYASESGINVINLYI